MNTNIEANISMYLIKHNIITNYMQYNTYDQKNLMRYTNHIKEIHNKKARSSNTLVEMRSPLQKGVVYSPGGELAIDSV